MKILNSNQVRAADQYTIKHEPIASIDLMERAAERCTDWLIDRFDVDQKFSVFCGIGNNGGDGLAIARMLRSKSYEVECFVVEFSKNYSSDCLTNKKRLEKVKQIKVINHKNELPTIDHNKIVIDAILGSGLSRPAEGIALQTIQHINSSNAKVISIDIPSGMYCSDNSKNKHENVIQADYTLSLELPKLAFLLPMYDKLAGEWHIIPIGLDRSFIAEQKTSYHLITEELVASFYKKRLKFSHKGTYGHALIIAGSKGKMGAATLATKACLRSGVGLVTAYVPECGYNIMQISIPEAMVITEPQRDFLSTSIKLENYKAIGIGPGIGTKKETAKFVESTLKSLTIPIVIDADALNIISKNKKLLNYVPRNSILTPHPKEFERLAGKTKSDEKRLKKQISLAKEHSFFVILKGAHTAIACPDGKVYFNNTGNPGMASGGSGDVLTGILIGLLAQGYSSRKCCLLGVYLHGLAGDIAIQGKSEESLIAGDIIENLCKAFYRLEKSV